MHVNQAGVGHGKRKGREGGSKIVRGDGGVMCAATYAATWHMKKVQWLHTKNMPGRRKDLTEMLLSFHRQYE